MSDLDRMITAGRDCIGSEYKFWGGGALEHWEPMFVNAPGLTPQYVRANGVNCSGLVLNAMQSITGLNYGKGGTLYYGQVMNPWEEYDNSCWYPVGTILVQPYIEGQSEGHIAMVTRPNQLVLQSDVPNGVNEYKTASMQHAWTPWAWAGWMPGVPAADWLPGWGSGGVYGYPGDWADPVDVALYMARVAEKVYGLPGILPVMCSCVELTDAWIGPGDVKGVTGYLGAVDYDSLGYFQQRPSQGWGTPEQIVNAEYALSRFLDAAWEEFGGNMPDADDAQALGDWCQRIQNSAYPDAYRDKGWLMASKLLGDPEEADDEAPADYQRFGWYERHADDSLTFYKGMN